MIVKHGKLKVEYSVHRNKRITGDSIPLNNYKQQDVHSCGFVAVLTVAQYFKPDVSSLDVLKAVRPSLNYGVNQESLTVSLENLGINVEFLDDLTLGKLRKYVKQGSPVIVSVWPDEWINDHWTIVQGFDDERVYLTNHKSLSFEAFKKQWSDMDMRGKGKSKEGLVCTFNDDD